MKVFLSNEIVSELTDILTLVCARCKDFVLIRYNIPHLCVRLMQYDNCFAFASLPLATKKTAAADGTAAIDISLQISLLASIIHINIHPANLERGAIYVSSFVLSIPKI